MDIEEIKNGTIVKVTIKGNSNTYIGIIDKIYMDSRIRFSLLVNLDYKSVSKEYIELFSYISLFPASKSLVDLANEVLAEFDLRIDVTEFSLTQEASGGGIIHSGYLVKTINFISRE